MNGSKSWYRLDNAAIIIPSTVNGADSRVFRVSCELKEDVDPEVLQSALDDVIRAFPHLNVVLRKGLFWYYLDGCDLKEIVTREKIPPLSPIYVDGRKTLLYRVSYYKKRINVEMFHVLADGTGGFIFLKDLVICYFNKLYDLNIPQESISADVIEEKAKNAFSENYQKARGNRQLKEMTSKRAYHLKGKKDENFQNHLIEATVSTGEFLKLAKQNNTTAGIYAVSLYILSILDEMKDDRKKLPIVVSVPVNLRQFYPSNTTRNFFGVINVRYDPDKYDGTIHSITEDVAASFKNQLTPSAIDQTMNAYSALVHTWAIKMVPLFIKDLVIERYYVSSQQGVTCNVSNLGVIKMPEELCPYINKFIGFMSSATMQTCIATFNDNMVFGAVSSFVENKVIKNLCRHLAEQGLEVEIATNDYNEGM